MPTRMIEVFKTDVSRQEDARRLIALIQERFSGYRANFDLDDCDRILRVHSLSGEISSRSLISLLLSQGFLAEVLP